MPRDEAEEFVDALEDTFVESLQGRLGNERSNFST